MHSATGLAAPPELGIGTFQYWYENRHEYARDWKERTGRKIVGAFCTYVPEEIVYAADMITVRVFGGHEPQDVTEPYIFGMYCPFCRDCLAQGLKGRYDYFDGLVLAHSCLHFRQTFDSWRLHIGADFDYYLPMPNQVQSPHARSYLQGELAKFKTFLEERIGRELTDDDLDRGIAVVNENRRLLRQIYEYRKRPNPPVTGLECMYMAITAQFVDKAEHNQALRAAIAEIEAGRDLNRGGTIRLLTVGSENDDPDFLEMAESLGATVVIDDQCAGSRFFWNEAVPQEDRLQAIANRYCDRPACPTKDYPERRRFPHVLGLAKDWGAQGAIVIQQKFCDPHEGDIKPLREYLESNGIPTVFLEFDATNPLGPFRIRVEAFLETLRNDDLFGDEDDDLF
ncbi:MAG: benzoyl-CoA reductase, bzd-type, subunit N [Dehalococcoidales bacterium]|nr:benzoyl-CoA reductase, bzd-type, subunit N [Dehalococcoidales bacterium]